MTEFSDHYRAALVTAAVALAPLRPALSIQDIIANLHTGVQQALEPKPEAPPPVEELKPAVPIRKSVTPDFIICLEDGKSFKSLKRHLRTAFGITPDEYRERWGLPADYPMVAPNYSATRSQLAKDNGLGRKA